MQCDGKVIDFGRLAAGDNAEWNNLVNTQRILLVRRVYQTTHDYNLAEDVVQTVFQRLWMRRSKLAHIDSLPSYLARSAKNTASTYLQKRANRKELPLRLGVARLIPASEQSNPRVVAECKEAGALLSQTMETFTPRQTQVMDHIRVDMDVSTRQLGEIMGCSHKNVQAIIGRIRAKLSQTHDLRQR